MLSHSTQLRTEKLNFLFEIVFSDIVHIQKKNDR